MSIAQRRSHCLHPLVEKRLLPIPALPPPVRGKCWIGRRNGNNPDLRSVLAHKRSRPARVVVAGDEQDFVGTVKTQVLVDELGLTSCGIQFVVQRSK